MGLLNERQLEDIMSNVHVCDEDWFEKLLRQWNDRQTKYHQVEVNWDDAPNYANKAVLRLHWVVETSSGSQLWLAPSQTVTFERPEVKIDK